MGCGNQVGCLGPKPRERQVYLDLIDKIYQDANLITINQSEDRYTAIKNHLTKKGLLRKLIDNLVSHKANLSQCLHQNWQMSVASKDVQGRITSLVIIDKICDEVFKEESANNSYETQNTRSLSVVEKARENVQLPSILTERFQNMYILSSTFLKLILFLFQNEASLNRQTTNSLKKFLKEKVQKQPWKGEMSDIFQFLVEKIKRDQETNQNAEMIVLLLKKVKETLANEIKQEVIVYFIRKCVQGEMEEGGVLSSSFLQILKQYFEKINGQFQNLSESLIKVLDQASFQPVTGLKVSNLIHQIAREKEGNNSFKKKLFNLLLNYLQKQFEVSQITNIKLKHYVDEKCKLNAFRLLTKWIIDKSVDVDAMIEYNPSVIMTPFLVNIESKKEAHFHSQLKRELYQIMTVLKQDSLFILINKICQQFAEKQIANRKREHILTLIFQILKEKETLIKRLKLTQLCKLKFLLNIQHSYNKHIKIELIQLAQFWLKKINLKAILQNAQTSNLFLMRLAEFLHSAYQEITAVLSHQETNHQEQQSREKQQLNNFFYMCNFIKKFSNLLLLLRQSELQVVLLCFMNPINSKILDNDPFQNQEQALTFFFLQFLIEKGLSILDKAYKAAEPISTIAQKIQSNKIKQEQRTQIIESARHLMKNELQNAQLGQYDAFEPSTKNDQLTYFIKINQKKIQKAIQKCHISSVQMIQTEDVFKYYFSPPFKQKSRSQPDSMAEAVFNRVPSINLSLDQIANDRLSPVNEGSQSFIEIMQKMHKE